MKIDRLLLKRSGEKCELCQSKENLVTHEFQPQKKGGIDEQLVVCKTCKLQIDNPEIMETNHWRCLNEAMWSEHKVVQLLSWRLLHRLKNVDWTLDLIPMMYFEEEDLCWANALGDGDSEEDKVIHKDVNGAVLNQGDSVVLIKDLDVKGTSFVAKRGTPVRNINLVHDNPEHIEGKVEGTRIVILTQYVKKT